MTPTRTGLDSGPAEAPTVAEARNALASPRRARVPGMPHRTAAHCGSGAFRDLLEYLGVEGPAGPLEEADVFGLAGGLDITWRRKGPGPLPFCLMGRAEELERQLCENLALPATLRRTDDATLAWRWIREEVGRGEPVLVCADLAQLPYLTGGLSLRVENSRHALIVCGYDEDDGVAWVADQYFRELQPVALETLARARAAHAFPGATRHATWILRRPAARVNVRTAVRPAICQVVAALRNVDRPAEADGCSAGLQALARLREDVARWHALDPVEASMHVVALRFWIRQAGTGGDFFRGLFTDFLEHADAWIGDAQLSDAVVTWRRSASAWEALARALRRPAPDVCEDIAQRLSDIADLELAGCEALERWLAGAGDA